MVLASWAVLALTRGDTQRRLGGVRLIYGPRTARWLRRFDFAAMAVGHVIVAPDRDTLREHLAHEWAHVRQARRWGWLFPLAYMGHSLFCTATRRHYYDDNHFERAACQFADLRSCRSAALVVIVRTTPQPVKNRDEGVAPTKNT